MDPYDLPEELSVLQSQDMGRIGFMQDITRGINKVLAGGVQTIPEVKANTGYAAAAAGSAERLIEKGDTYIKLKKFDEAQKCFGSVTQEYPEDYRGWRGLILCATANFTKEADGLDTVAAWVDHVRQLANPDRFNEFQNEYTAYAGRLAGEDAVKEMNLVNNTINNMKSKVKISLMELEAVKQKIKNMPDINDYVEDAIEKRDKILKWRKKGLIFILIGFIVGVSGIVFVNISSSEGMFFLFLVIYLILQVVGYTFRSRALPRKLSFWRWVFIHLGFWLPAAFFGAGGMIYLLFSRKPIKKRIAKFDDYIMTTETEESASREKELATANGSIKTLEREIAQTKEKIANCENYLALGEGRITSNLLVLKCGSIGIKYQPDIEAIRLRNSALG